MSFKEHFHWLVPQSVATQVAGQILRRRNKKQKKIVAASRDTSPKLKLISTSRNNGGNKKFYLKWKGMLSWAIFRATCVAKKLRDELHEKLPGLTGLKAHHVCFSFR